MRTLLKIRDLLCLLSVAFLVTQECRANLVSINSGFESPSIASGTNWHRYDSTGLIQTATSGGPLPSPGAALPGWDVIGQVDVFNAPTATSIPNRPAAYEGKQYLELSGAAGTAGSISQVIATTPGGQYTVSFALNASFRDPATDFGLLSFGNQVQGLSFSAPSTGSIGWVVQSFSFFATETQTLLTFSGTPTSTGGSLYLDDVSVVPEPASIALTGLGFVGLIAGWPRRRRN